MISDRYIPKTPIDREYLIALLVADKAHAKYMSLSIFSDEGRQAKQDMEVAFATLDSIRERRAKLTMTTKTKALHQPSRTDDVNNK